ncbi:phage distal tail protein [Actinacidiphila sp. ITFR-21]|uniref:phage distal tail protein n=1 Tax=Actinacidiphila sp. ITFR-21 TaxID=3075199 RepID=UPI0028894335|nr:phage tail domain-containing protein [Streptomyces sp. ITFR-21]WNI15579.1 phage tail family protein [Streptomyces sp. ITFR-21]
MATPQRIGRIQWGDLLIGPGTGYHVQALSGVDDLPDVRSADTAKSDAHGDYTGPDYVGPRVVQLSLNLMADTPDELRQMILDLRRATQPGRAPADFQLLDWGISVSGKVRKRSIPYDAEYLWRSGTAAIEWYCADPYLYGLDQQAVSTVAYSPSAGRTYPRTYPMSYGATGSSGTVDAVNNGDSPAYPVLRLDGPVANPSIEQPDTGALLALDATLTTGDYLLIDTRSRAVLLQGTTPRRNWIRGGSTWPLLMPGSNQLTYRGSALPGAPGQSSLLTVTWRDTSL